MCFHAYACVYTHTHARAHKMSLIKVTWFGAAAPLTQKSPEPPRGSQLSVMCFVFASLLRVRYLGCPGVLGRIEGLSIRGLVGKELFVTSPWLLSPVVAGGRELGFQPSEPIPGSCLSLCWSWAGGLDAREVCFSLEVRLSSPGPGIAPFLQGLQKWR